MYAFRGLGATLNYPQIDQAITNFEGKPGDLNYRNNNPGNMVYAPWMAAYGCSAGGAGGFATCVSMDAGQAVLDKRVTDLVSQGDSVSDLLYTWAGPQYSGNSQTSYDNYVASVAASTGLDPSLSISQQLSGGSDATTGLDPSTAGDLASLLEGWDGSIDWPLIAAAVGAGVLLVALA